MDVTARLIATIPVGNTLGEGVLWRPSDQTIWWTDIQESCLYCLNWGATIPARYDAPQRIGSFGFVLEDPDRLIVAFESGFAYFTPKSGHVDWLAQPDELALGSGRRLNDGRVGPDGAFWAGSMLEQGGVPGGTDQTGFYRLSPSGDVTLVWPGLTISNGLCWSPDKKTAYFSDSVPAKIYSTDFDPATGRCGPVKDFARVKDGGPDGAITDASGHYWSAIWGGSCLIGFNTEGLEVARIDLPVPQPTIPVFGGPDFDHLIVTSARQDLSDEDQQHYPDSGHLFIYETNLKGLPPDMFGAA